MTTAPDSRRVSCDSLVVDGRGRAHFHYTVSVMNWAARRNIGVLFVVLPGQRTGLGCETTEAVAHRLTLGR